MKEDTFNLEGSKVSAPSTQELLEGSHAATSTSNPTASQVPSEKQLREMIFVCALRKVAITDPAQMAALDRWLRGFIQLQSAAELLISNYKHGLTGPLFALRHAVDNLANLGAPEGVALSEGNEAHENSQSVTTTEANADLGQTEGESK